MVADAEVGGGVEAGDGAGGDVAPVISGEEQGLVEAGGLVDGLEVLYVGVIVGEVAVLILNLRHEDGAATTQLEWGGLLGEAFDPAFGWEHEGGVVGTDLEAVGGVADEPRGRPPKSHSAQE